MVIIPSPKQGIFAFVRNFHGIAHFRSADIATHGPQGQRLKNYLDNAPVPVNVNMGWRVVMHVNHETETRFNKNGGHGAVYRFLVLINGKVKRLS